MNRPTDNQLIWEAYIGPEAIREQRRSPEERQQIHDDIIRYQELTDPDFYDYEGDYENQYEEMSAIERRAEIGGYGRFLDGAADSHFGRGYGSMDTRVEYGRDPLASRRGLPKRTTKSGRLNRQDANALKTRIQQDRGMRPIR